MATGEIQTQLEQVLSLPVAQQPASLLNLGQSVTTDPQSINGVRGKLVDALVEVIDQGVGTGRERLELGEVLGALGDPRLNTPDQADYWVQVAGETGKITIGRFPVTNYEFKKFVESGAYDDAELWTEDGLAWLEQCEDPWPARASAETSRQFVVDNQPVVGVTYHEAMAYANAHQARLPRVDERVWVIRGSERRPYPWGKPFGEGNANTREEVLGRPCAVGLFIHDKTPEGVYDLAGNVAEWSSDGVGRERLIHPGAWDQPSLAAWAKALSLESPDSRWAGLGFRLARD